MIDQQLVVKCIHHWVIEVANGPHSTGLCSICGLSKTFDNSVPKDREMGSWKVGRAQFS